MRAVTASLIAVAMAVLAGCTTVPANKGVGSVETDSVLEDNIASIRMEVRDLRSEIDTLRGDIIRLEAKVSVLAHSRPREENAGTVSRGGTAKLWKTIDEVSDVQVYWSGEVRGIEFFLCPVTKKKETKIFDDQLGDGYAYMWLQIINVNKEGTGYRFDPKKGLFTLEIESEGAGGRKKFQVSFDPREVISVREMQLGAKLALSEHFEARNVMPGQKIQTHVLLPESVDFAKIKAVYMGKIKMHETKP